VRPYRQADVPPRYEPSVTITQAGRVLLNAHWEPHLRELGSSVNGREVLLDEADAAALEQQTLRFFCQRLGLGR
jgi:hypothetical protein